MIESCVSVLNEILLFHGNTKALPQQNRLQFFCTLLLLTKLCFKFLLPDIAHGTLVECCMRLQKHTLASHQWLILFLFKLIKFSFFLSVISINQIPFNRDLHTLARFILRKYPVSRMKVRGVHIRLNPFRPATRSNRSKKSFHVFSLSFSHRDDQNKFSGLDK